MMRTQPAWSRTLGAALALLLVNLFWNHPLRAATGGDSVAFFVFNLLPSAAAAGWIIRGGAPPRR